MVLSDSKIREQIGNSSIFIGLDRNNSYPVERLRFDSMAVDLHLGNEFRVWKDLLPGEESIFDPSLDAFNLVDVGDLYSELAHLERDGSFILKPKSFALGTTKQYIKLPLTTSARIEGRSKLVRLGVGIHVTAPTIHAGFEGTITLEIFNHSPRSVKLKPWVSLEEEGLRIGQLIFETVEGTVSQTQNTSTFRNQTGTLG